MENKIEIYLIVFFISFILFFIGIVALFMQYKNKQKTAIKEKVLTEQLHQQQLLSTQLEIQTQTMQHIGREIHDNVGQKLTLASLYTQQLAFENKAPQVTDKIENISNIINESLAQLRQLSKSLTDDSINNNSLIELLNEECKKVTDLKKCAVHFNSNKKNIDLPYQTKSILLRIVQEFLQNSIKHADCKNIIVAMEVSDVLLLLSMKDDGCGFTVDNAGGRGIGLDNMKKRTALIGGSFNLQSSPVNGTDLQIAIPLKSEK
jgi:signal transduction histidine kinase